LGGGYPAQWCALINSRLTIRRVKMLLQDFGNVVLLCTVSYPDNHFKMSFLDVVGSCVKENYCIVIVTVFLENTAIKKNQLVLKLHL
jgi:hypothetical protein